MAALNLMVCPHDTVRNSEAWYRLVQYLTKQTGVEIHFELTLDFADFHANLDKAHLVYANPGDTLKLVHTKGFHAIARPADHYDEAVLVAATDVTAPSVAAMQGETIATVAKMLPTRLALRVLEREGVQPAGLADCDSWLGVVRNVWGGDAPFGILYSDAYDDLSEQGKGMVQVIAKTNERVAFHSFCACADCGDDCDKITAALHAMHTNPEGQSVLADLDMPAWVAVQPEELTALQAVLN
jgi:ABC-type phosphate/phosphonate transport system substrate-binding protein